MPRRSTEQDPERALMIQCKVCQRLMKELDHYKAELTQNETKLAQQTDVYDIKHYENMVAESRMMVPDTHRRLSLALEQLQQLVGTCTDESNEWEDTAMAILQQHGKEFQIHDVLLHTPVDDVPEGEAF